MNFEKVRANGDSSIGPEDHVLEGAEVAVLCITKSREVLNYQAFTDAKGKYAVAEAYNARENAEHCLWMKEFMNSGSDIEHEAFLALWLSRSSKIIQKNRSKRVRRVNHITEGFSFSRPMMKTKESEETSTEKEDVSDASDSSELPSKMLPLSLIIKKEINMSPFPPGFPPKTNLVEARDSTTVDNLTTTRLLMSSMRHSDVGNGQLGDGEHSSGHCQKFSSSKVVKDAEKIVVPSTEPIEKMKQNELVKSRLETSREDATGSKTGSPSHDMEGSHGVDGDVNENELQLEDRVSRLERFFAELKAARFGSKKQIISSE
ncbi:hypothetical protein Dsin_023030 [Dipteronia sinensis]|uniref:Uncharacterized protein n=1 Tax=Dipteronia sinensis TaxID=43782 RepID=A0AAE0E0A9_9ROSI|nr:hypothetical protein Dsin_023030 [Dipteronia sinensis]